MYNKTMDYEWDETKRQRNVSVHGVDFKDIEQWDWEGSLIAPDPRFAEERYAALGLIGDRLHYVAYTLRNGKKRLISMRKANRREIRKYEQAQEN